MRTWCAYAGVLDNVTPQRALFGRIEAVLCVRQHAFARRRWLVALGNSTPVAAALAHNDALTA